VASREYLARNARIREPKDILGHQLLHEDNLIRWRNWLASHGVHPDEELSGPRLWQAQLALEAARHGRGVALINYLVVAEELKQRQLVDIGAGLDSFEPPAMGILQFVARSERWDALPIRSFRDWLTTTIAKDHPELKVPDAG
jgi:DNA-binding transcriptional LysR family regulator